MTQPPTISGMTERRALGSLRQDIGNLSEAGHVYLDFDHTLFLWNSTEAFLNEARPSSILAPLLKLVSGLVPWSVLGNNGYFVLRDAIRLTMVLLLAPWTLQRFRKVAPEIYARERNPFLEAAIGGLDPNRIIIVSFGLHWIIRALLKGSPLEHATIVAPSLFELPSARARGKLVMLARDGFTINPDTDIVVSDSAKDDADILKAVRQAHVIRWAAENTAPAHASAYFPFFYTARIKRSPGFLVKQVFLEELPVILIMFAALHGPSIVPVLICLGTLFVSYLLVYEVGYAENDLVGEATEAQPKLSEGFFAHRTFRLEPDVWVWATLITLAAFAVTPQDLQITMLSNLQLQTLLAPEYSVWLLTAVWMVFLGVSRAIFYVFNHVPLAWRVFVYLPLHATKYFGPLLLLPIHPAGVALGFAQVVRTWSMYAIRRAGGDEHALSSQMVRLTFLCMFSVVVFSIAELTRDEAFLLALAFAFCILRALPEARKKMFGNAARLGKVL